MIVEYDLKHQQETEIYQLKHEPNASLQVIDDQIYFSTKASGVGVLYSYHLQTGELIGHTVGIFKDFVILENGDMVYVRDASDGFGSEIWKYQAGDQSQNGIKKIGRVDQLISEIIAYQDDYLVVSKERFGSWNINRLAEDDEAKGHFSLTKVINSPYVEKSIKVEGDLLTYTANYNHSYALYQYDLQEQELIKGTSLSYAADGVVDEGAVYFVGLTAHGEAVYQTDLATEQYPLPKEEELEQVDLNQFTKKSKSSFETNLAYLAQPYVKFPFLQGEDALGLLSYRINYLDHFDTNVVRETYGRVYNSYSLSLNKSEITQERQMNLLLQYDNGKNLVNLIFGQGISYGDWSYYKTIAFKNSNLHFIGTGVYAPKVSGMTFGPASSYLSSLYGIKARLGYTYQLFELQKGFWNPNIYLGDLYGDLSVETYVNLESTLNYDPYYPYDVQPESGYTIVGSYKVMLETLFGFDNRWVPSARLGVYTNVNKAGEVEKSAIDYFVNISTGF